MSKKINNICDQTMGLSTRRAIIYALARKHQMKDFDDTANRTAQCHLLARIKLSRAAEELLSSQIIVVHSHI